MAEGESLLHGVLESEDTTVMVDAWRTLGLPIEWDKKACTIRMVGCGGQPPKPYGDLFIANSGTSIRFLTAALSATKGNYVLDGVARMRERPIGDLIDGLKAWGAQVESTNINNPSCPPVQLNATGIDGGFASVKGNVSSQFLSGMMMAAPYARRPVTIAVSGELVSKPYVDMTVAVMKSFGVLVDTSQIGAFKVDAPQKYTGCQYHIEPDASAASYFLAAAAITGGRVRVDGLSMNALQGDVRFARVLEQMGCQVIEGTNSIEVIGLASQGIDVDMNEISDTVQTLAAVAVFANSPTRVRGVAHNRHKETDRIGDLARELRKVGAKVEEHEDGMTIFPGKMNGCPLDTYHDHRMAMSLALIGLRVPEIEIMDPRCTEKTYPNFFEDLGSLIGQSPFFQY